ncbi:5-(carboxyamino)imidazole ribonucleotide synthase [Boudabousia tangfeifanii]|uniref:N5-carboxyaminoimidazole ribonucleotide synthase n=1 Tax=Boudabousia tangfeifanii TaxID=1912795 RepID=A0A1D9MJT1_9ACTO|nr:5-(carboxyamino)imidazole ribonucleotide synthase [Boudabousia tangfeifanii]AOZ72430.1 5-(carboxyamino)imidazole ribonucleotide synthase [Boudabousia tangfeifanii]
MAFYKVAVIGAGQLARMMTPAAEALDIELRVLAQSQGECATKVICNTAIGSPKSVSEVAQICDGADVLTFEHEHIGSDVLSHFGKKMSVQPSASALLYAQDKLALRRKLTELGLPQPAWKACHNNEDVAQFLSDHGPEIVIKTPTGGYDGKGVKVIRAAEEIADWWQDREVLLAEEKVPFTMEVAALLARRPSGASESWPLVQTIQANGVCHTVIAPAPRITEAVQEEAKKVSQTIAKELGVTGVLAVEMFVSEENGKQRVLVNELAMRPHNSGHWTMDGANISQFEQHLRAVLDLPLQPVKTLAPFTVMVNILGTEDGQEPASRLAAVASKCPNAKVHLYGKDVKPGRKLGHVNVIGNDLKMIKAEAEEAVEILRGEKR